VAAPPNDGAVSRQQVARDQAGALAYLYSDALHSVASASSLAPGGDAYTYQEYGPYGGRRWPWGTSGLLPSPYQFQGQDLEWTTGGTYLYHMGARWYDPYTGLWTQPDTVVPDPTDPLSLNRYSFVEGNPLRSTDPSGHAATTGCQDPSTCPSGNPPPGMAGSSSSSAPAPPTGQDPCDLMPLACKPVGNYAVWVYDGETGQWIYLPIPGAIPPPDASGDPNKFSDEEDFAKLLEEHPPSSDSAEDKGDPPSENLGDLFRKAGVRVTAHFLQQLTTRQNESGITEEMALETYLKGERYYDSRYDTYIHYSSKYGLAVAVNSPEAEVNPGQPNTVFDRPEPNPAWEPMGQSGGPSE
jgi:RHS repeat-associated protein